MSEGINCEFLDLRGRHDWRVDPSQVILTARIDGSDHFALVRVTCASCRTTDTLESRRRFSNDPTNPSTWRPYMG